MRATITLSLALLALSGCEPATLEPPARCVAVAGDPAPSPAMVCANFARLGCVIDDCAGAYASYRTRVAPDEFARLTSCYARARSCDEVDQCERGCGPDGGAVRVGPPGSVDAGPLPNPDASIDVPAPQDASTDAGDAPTATDATDVPTATDVPVTNDVPAATDVPVATDVTDVPVAIDVTDVPAPSDVVDAATKPDAATDLGPADAATD